MKRLLALACLLFPGVHRLSADEPPPEGTPPKPSEEVKTKSEEVGGTSPTVKKPRIRPAVYLSKEADRRLIDLLGADQIVVRMLAEEAVAELRFQPAVDKLLKRLEDGPPPQNCYPVHIRKIDDKRYKKDVEKRMLLQERILIVESLAKIGNLDSKLIEHINVMAEKDEADFTKEALDERVRLQVDSKRASGGATVGGDAFHWFWSSWDDAGVVPSYSMSAALARLNVDSAYYSYRQETQIPASLLETLTRVVERIPKLANLPFVNDEDVPDSAARLRIVRDAMREYWGRIDQEIKSGTRKSP